MGNSRRQQPNFQLGANADHPQFVTALARGLSILRCFQRGEHYLGNQ